MPAVCLNSTTKHFFPSPNPRVLRTTPHFPLHYRQWREQQWVCTFSGSRADKKAVFWESLTGQRFAMSAPRPRPSRGKDCCWICNSYLSKTERATQNKRRRTCADVPCVHHYPLSLVIHLRCLCFGNRGVHRVLLRLRGFGFRELSKNCLGLANASVCRSPRLCPSSSSPPSTQRR